MYMDVCIYLVALFMMISQICISHNKVFISFYIFEMLWKYNMRTYIYNKNKVLNVWIPIASLSWIYYSFTPDVLKVPCLSTLDLHAGLSFWHTVPLWAGNMFSYMWLQVLLSAYVCVLLHAQTFNSFHIRFTCVFSKLMLHQIFSIFSQELVKLGVS